MPINFSKALCVLFITSGAMMSAQSGPPLPPLSGVVQDVQKVNTAKLLSVMNQGSNDFVALAAHRGYWINSPENSDPALRAAYSSGVEIIEIDCRLSSDGILMISHDLDLQKETDGSGLVANTSSSTMLGMNLRDHKGHVPEPFLHMLRFTDALRILMDYQQMNPNLMGPVLIADLKDSNLWSAYLEGIKELKATLPASSWPAVVFKGKMKNLPSLATIQAEAAAHPAYGHLLPTVNSEDAKTAATGFDGPDWDASASSGIDWQPNHASFLGLVSLSNQATPFVQQFELNSNIPTDGTSAYVEPNGPLGSFATYYQPSAYPEGVSGRFGDPATYPSTRCCYIANLKTSSDPNTPQDKRGIVTYSLFLKNSSNTGTSTITSDNLTDVLDLLVSLGKRNLTEIQ